MRLIWYDHWDHFEGHTGSQIENKHILNPDMCIYRVDSFYQIPQNGPRYRIIKLPTKFFCILFEKNSCSQNHN